jgi:hypothetical protein
MKTNSSALTSADPVGSFLQTLPRKANVLGFKGYSYPDKKSIAIMYSDNGVVHRAECHFKIVTKGGES